MRCPSCHHDLPHEETLCPTCSTSRLESAGLAIGLAPDAGEATRKGRPAAGKGGEAPAARFVPGTLLADRYRISVRLGRGGMGELYRADDLKLQQTVALKLLPEAVEEDAEKLALLADEVRLARRITHPNVCRIYDLGEAEGRRFISMEYIDGEDLGSLLRRIGRLPEAKALEIAHDLCRGLGAAHDEGILHRDIKPSNLMIDGTGRARITDFGLAIVAESLGAEPELRAGTPAYMAPEQLSGGQVSVRSDLYALGLVLYELFTGRKPFAGWSLGDLIRSPREDELTPPTELLDGLDPAIDRAVLGCLAKDPGDRPESAHVLAAALPGGDAEAAAWRPAEGGLLPRRPHWRLKRRLGTGGFGDAWLGTHVKTGEERVFKFCHAARHLHALKREITLFRLLKEELGERRDITRILDWSFDEPPFYIESEYTRGGNLMTWAAEQGGVGLVPLETRLEIIAQAAEALSAAHSVGVLHKDVKPSNVLIHDGPDRPVQVRLNDFGVGLLTEDARLTEFGITPVSVAWTAGPSGTPLYRAPELLEGKPPTVQADIYALGVMLYQLVAGDLNRALGPGWERDVDDELLREDIAETVDGNPRRRLGNALRLAERLRSLEARQAERQAERQAHEEAERARFALERLRRRLRRTAIAVVGVLLAAAATFQAVRVSRQARAAQEARQLLRVAVASEWLAKDPTRAALVLLEIDDLGDSPEAMATVHEVLGEKLAALEVRHGDWVLDAAWSPDGERFATASVDRTVRVWDLVDGGGPLTLSGHDGPVLAIAWSPDGGRLASASQDGTAWLWELGNGAEAGGTVFEGTVLEGHENWIWDVAWSPDGERFATASWDHTARVWWSDETGTIRSLVLEGHEERVVSVAWHGDGERLATASWDGTARVWTLGSTSEAPRARAPRVLRGPEALWKASWSPDGRRLATASWDGTARIWNVAGSSDPVVLQAPGSLRTVGWSPDGRRLVTASSDGTARVWNADGSPVRLADGEAVVFRHDDEIVTASWSPDGRRVVTASSDGTARVWYGDGSRGRAASILSRRDRSLHGLVLRGHRGEVRNAAWSPDGRRLVTASRDGTARVWDLSSDFGPLSTVVEVAEADRLSFERSWSPDGGRYVTAGEGPNARVWAADGSGSLVLRHGATVLAAAFSADGELVLTATADGTIWGWNADGSGEAVALRGPSEGSVAAPAGSAGFAAGAPGVLAAAAFDPRGEYVAAVARDGRVEVWPLAGPSSRAVIRLVSPEGPLEAAAWSATGGSVLTLSAGRTAREWRLGGSDLLEAVRAATAVCLDPEFRQTQLGEAAPVALERFSACERSHDRGK